MITQMKANTLAKTWQLVFRLQGQSRNRETERREGGKRERERESELEGLSDKAEALTEWMSYRNRGEMTVG